MPVKLNSDVTWPEGKGPGWQHTPDGLEGGRFGCIEHRVVCKPSGEPIFDRPVVVEGPHVITVSWGVQNGQVKLGLVKEARDTAAPLDGHSTVAFWGPPRGFRDHGETPTQAARREAGEEAGARVVVGKPVELGEFITNETCTASWSPVVALQVDLDRLFDIQPDRGEKIYKAGWFTLDEVETMLRNGKYDGGLTTSFVLVSTVCLFRSRVLPRITADGTLAPA